MRSRNFFIIFLIFNSCFPSNERNNCNNGHPIYFMKNYLYKNQKVKLLINNKCIYDKKETKDHFLNLSKKEYFTELICAENDSISVGFSINSIDTTLILSSRAINGLILGSDPDGSFYIISDYKDSGWYVGMKPTGYD
jgi:hypothetical protein